MRVLVICFIERQTKKCIGIIKKKFYITVWKLKKIKRSSLKHWKAKILLFLIKAPLVEPGGARGARRSPDWAPGSSEKIWRSPGPLSGPKILSTLVRKQCIFLDHVKQVIDPIIILWVRPGAASIHKQVIERGIF